MKNYILYYLVIRPISYMPFAVLYLISDLIFLVVYHVIGYRRKVVSTNLKKSFPEKTAQELKLIEKKFYSHLSDLIVESFKTFTISEEESLKRMKISNPDLMNKYFDQGKSIVTVGGHNGNWELYAVACALQIKHSVAALYTPLKNKFFDKLMRSSRSRFGLNMIPTSAKDSLPINSGKPTMLIFGIDQCPGRHQRAYWMEFLNQETGVQFGAEKFARQHNLPVVFGNISKIKRGYYEITYELICEDPSEVPIGGILEKSTLYLEGRIKNQPDIWLWSHKRWKHAKEDCVTEPKSKDDIVAEKADRID